MKTSAQPITSQQARFARSTSAVRASTAPSAPLSAAVRKPATPHATRRPGRPSGQAGDGAQRERLLVAALTLFAQQGIADTSLAAIAREAGVTPAMVHYYFRRRDQFIDVLIDEHLAPLRAAMMAIFDAHANDPATALTELTLRLIELGEKHPWFAPLWLREVISEGGTLRQRMHERFGDAHRHMATARIAQWQREGKLNAGLEPTLLLQSLLGLTILPLANARLWRHDPARRRIGAHEIARHALALITHGVMPVSTPA